MSQKVKRLIQQFKPSEYALDLVPNRDKMTFSGTVVILGYKVGPPSQRITFHQKNLIVTKAIITKLYKKGEIDIKVSRINTQKSFDEVRVHTEDKVYPGAYRIEIEFNGEITTPMDGIYPCIFKLKGQDKKLIATQFESHFARQVFPCIDEPEAKAKFSLKITTPKNETVVSNTPIKNQKSIKDTLVTEFETTPIMSTYLLAFIYGELGYREAKTKDGTVVRAYATPENTKLTEFALQTTVRCLEFYENYFGIKYPLKKCDIVALPDFAAAGMENWGCITFSELAMLVDEKNTSISSKQVVAEVVAHEISHQWFGNLVTMKWWTDLWLNEGFATWMTHIAIDELFPQWKIWTQFLVGEQQMAMKYDALEHTRSIEVPSIDHPDEIRVSFDPPISYGKSSSVIHMLYHYLGADVFQAGVQFYLKKFSYKNTLTEDLWDSLEKISGKPVKAFMHDWIAKPGFPVVSAVVKDNKAISLSQARFYINQGHKDSISNNWPIPLLASDSTLSQEVLTKTVGDYSVANTDDFKLNQGQSGFYRVAYNSSHLVRLGSLIKKGRMNPLDRLGLLNDLVEGAKAGAVDTLDALGFLSNFGNEDDYAVWEVIAGLIGNLKLAMNDEQLRELMKPYILKIVDAQLKRLGWDQTNKDEYFDKLLRPIILSLAASADSKDIVEKCLLAFKQIKHSEELASELRTVNRGSVKRGSDIDPDLRGTVFGTVARLGGAKEFEKLVKLHNEATLSEERVTIASALTGFKQKDLIEKSLAMINSKEVRIQDIAYWVSYSFANRYAKVQTWEWLKANWSWLKQNIGSDLSFYYMPIYSARVFSDIKFLPEYKKFFSSVMVPGLERPYNRGIEMIEWQSAWKKRDLKEVKNFFKSQK